MALPNRGITTKRHAKKLRNNLAGVTQASIRRLARRGGVKRIQFAIYADIRDVLKKRLRTVLHDAIVYADHSKRKTVTVQDIVWALKQQGTPIMGFGNGHTRYGID